MNNTNYFVDKTVLNFIHARGFYDANVANTYASTISESYGFISMDYGLQLQRFNMIEPDFDVLVGSLLGNYVNIEKEESGVFRLPYDNLIHFESFYGPTEWRLAVALDDNTFKTYRHKSGVKDARGGYKFNYTNQDDWTLETQINIAGGDAIFYRPWIFHSFEAKYILCFKIVGQEE